MEKTMKIQEKNSRVKRRIKFDGIIFALLCIAAGLVFFARNTGAITPELFDVLISWQMLLTVVGLYIMSHKGWMSGALVTGIGVFYMIHLANGSNSEWIYRYQPLVFVFIGLLLLIRIIMPQKWKRRHRSDNMTTSYKTENGFVYSENSFSGTKHVVMDKVFRGARIVNSFGATELDLRNTSIQEGETCIDIDSRCGGIEIRVPENWLVLTELNASMSGVSDDRHTDFSKCNESLKLILRGNLSLSGVVIKN